VPDDTNGEPDAYRFDLLSRTFELVARDLAGGPADDRSYANSLSGDGNLVAISSAARDLTEDGVTFPPLSTQIYVRDMTTGAIRLITRALDGGGGDGWSHEARLSRTGHFVAFESTARNLVEQSSAEQDIFRADTRTGQIELVSIGLDGADADDSSFVGDISGNGRFVVFHSWAKNLVPYPVAEFADVYLYDTSYDRTYLISHGFRGGPAEGEFAWSGDPVLGASSRFVAFTSSATNIVRADVDDEPDVFRYRITKVGLLDRGG
jgi:Tol biopolymer transport system component